MRIAVDAMGGDHAPGAVVEGALLFAREFPGEELVLVGDERRIDAELRRLGAHSPPESMSVRHASEVVEMGDHPGQGVRQKKDSSVRVCFDLIREKQCDGMVSAGNSGAVVAGALLLLGRLEQVDRPCIATALPTPRGMAVLADAGATVDCKPLNLVQFALMTEVYARKALGIANPRVGVLSNGEEDIKGTDLTRKTLEVLRRSSLNVIGYAEGKDLFSGDVDVVVTDGFTGNVALKAAEGVALAVGQLLRREVEKRMTARLGALLMNAAFSAFRKRLDYAEYGGAPLLGVDGVAIIAHGRSSPKAIKNAVRAGMEAVRGSLASEIGKAVASSSDLVKYLEKNGRNGA